MSRTLVSAVISHTYVEGYSNAAIICNSSRSMVINFIYLRFDLDLCFGTRNEVRHGGGPVP